MTSTILILNEVENIVPNVRNLLNSYGNELNEIFLIDSMVNLIDS